MESTHFEKYQPWTKPILNEQNDIFIANINTALTSYETDYQENKPIKEKLENIINACDQYIKQIPKKNRSSFIANWPHLLKVLEIQKNAVSRWYLPDLKTNTKNTKQMSRDNLARIEFLRELILDEQSHVDNLPTGRMLKAEYWDEFKYKGRIFIALWVKGEGMYSNSLLSFGEVVQELKNSFDNVGAEPDYRNKDKFFKNVTIKSGSLYIDGHLLDSQNAESLIHHLQGEILFAIDRSNNFYVNDPNQKIGTDAYHSVPLQGKRALCAGTLKVVNGKITTITMDSGHYKPRYKELVNFLQFLQKSGVDLSSITIIDRGGFPKNALRYLKYKGFTLPDKGEMFYKLAKEIEKDQKRQDEWRYWITKAAGFGHEMAKFEKAKAQAHGWFGYSKEEYQEGINKLFEMYEDKKLNSTMRQRIRIELRELGVFKAALQPSPLATLTVTNQQKVNEKEEKTEKEEKKGFSGFTPKKFT